MEVVTRIRILQRETEALHIDIEIAVTEDALYNCVTIGGNSDHRAVRARWPHDQSLYLRTRRNGNVDEGDDD